MENTENEDSTNLTVNGISNEDPEETTFNEEIELASSREQLCPDQPEQNEDNLHCSRRTKLISIQIAIVVSVLTVAFSIGLYFTETTPTTSSKTFLENTTMKEYNSSLLSYFKAMHYDVLLNIDLNRMNQGEGHSNNFSGNVAMYIACISMTSQIVLNSDVIINIQSVSVRHGDFDGRILNVTNIDEDKLREIVIISLNETVKNSSVLYVTMTYKGLMNYKDKHGLSLVTYTGEDGSVRKMVVSSLSPSYTRRLFPCLDEPKKKATFNLTVRRPPTCVALSNMHVMNSGVLESGYLYDSFAKTPKMAPHALSLVVAQLNYTNVTWKGLEIKIWSRESMLPLFDVAASMVAPSVEAMQNYTGIMYPLPKLDIIAVPDYTLRRADNWGCVITNENNILFNSNFSNVADAVNVKINVALMVSHQWFGNLVSCESWSDLWLQEGLATFFAFTALDFIYKEGKMFEIFLSRIESAMEEDAILLKNFFEQNVDFFDDRSSIFSIKSAALVRMVRFFITEPSFQFAIKDLLSSKAHSTVSTEDFCHALEKFEDFSLYKRPANVSKILQSWVQNPSYPVIFVTHDNDTFHLQQQPFTFELGIFYQLNSTRLNYNWFIPITHRTHSSRPNWSLTWLKNSSAVLGNFPNFSVPVLNTLEQGLYRVCYDKETWRLILVALMANISDFNVETRAGLISDVFALARARLVEEVFVLEFIQFLENETEFLPWQTFLQDSVLSFAFYDRMLFSTPIYPKFVKYIRKLVEPTYLLLYSNVFNEKEYSRRLLQTQIINLACHVGIKACSDGAAELFQMRMDSPLNTNLLAPQIGKVVFCEGVKRGGYEQWHFAFGMWSYTRGKELSHHKDWAHALGCTTDMSRLRKYVEKIIDVKDFEALQNVFSQVKSLRKILPILHHFWKDIRKTFGDERRQILKNVALSIVSSDGLKRLENWLEPLTADGEDPGIILPAVKIAEENFMWMRQNYKNISKWLNSFSANGIRT